MIPPVAAFVTYLWFIDPAWAIPANTLLLLFVSVSNRRHAQRAERAEAAAAEAVKIVDRRKTQVPTTQRRREDDAPFRAIG